MSKPNWYGTLKSYDEKCTCCGKDFIVGHYNMEGRNEIMTRHLCDDCDDLRCDAFPGSCKWEPESKRTP